MSLRFPQAVRPLGEPLELLEVQIRLSNELADHEMSYDAPTLVAASGDFIPDWDPVECEDGPASKKAKQGEPAPTEIQETSESSSESTSESETAPNKGRPAPRRPDDSRENVTCPVQRELRLRAVGTYASYADPDMDWILKSETAPFGLVCALEQQKKEEY